MISQWKGESSLSVSHERKIKAGNESLPSEDVRGGERKQRQYESHLDDFSACHFQNFDGTYVALHFDITIKR